MEWRRPTKTKLLISLACTALLMTLFVLNETGALGSSSATMVLIFAVAILNSVLMLILPDRPRPGREEGSDRRVE